MKSLPLTLHCLAFRHNAALQEVLGLPIYTRWCRTPLTCPDAVPDSFDPSTRRKIIKSLRYSQCNIDHVKEIYNFTKKPTDLAMERLRCVNVFAKNDADLFDIVNFAKGKYPQFIPEFDEFESKLSRNPKLNPSPIKFPDISELGYFLFKNKKDDIALKKFHDAPHEALFLIRQGELEVSEEMYRVLTWWFALRIKNNFTDFKIKEYDNPNELAKNYLQHFNDKIGVVDGWFYAIRDGIPVKFPLI